MTWVLIVSYYDRSGIRHVWGPFPDEAEATEVGRSLQDIGVEGLYEAMPLRILVPLEERTTA